MNRTPEEVKKGLECCLEEHACVRCPYDDCDEGWHCVVERDEDALAYIKQLEDGAANMAKIIESAYKQRDAAIEDLRGRCFACVHAKPHDKYLTLISCPHTAAAIGGKGKRDCAYWQWRGVQE